MEINLNTVLTSLVASLSVYLAKRLLELDKKVSELNIHIEYLSECLKKRGANNED